MTTLLFTHEACLAHDPGPRHPKSPGAAEAVLAALAAPAFAALDAARGARSRAREQIARVHPGDFVDALLAAVPKQGHAAIDADTIVSPRLGRGGAARGGRRLRRGRCGDGGRGAQRLLRRAAARPSCRAATRDGLLPLQQRRDRRALHARARAWARARRRDRFRRPSRQRHAGDLRARSHALLCLDASVAALSRHRRARASAASATSSTRRCRRCAARTSSARR